MRRVFLALFFAWSGNSFACEVCGAMTGALGPGTIAAGNRHAVGLSYQFRNYHSHHPGIFGLPDENSYERFQRTDVTGTFRVASRWQLKALLPLAFNQQKKNNVLIRQQGVADPTLSAHFFVVNRQDSSGTVIRWSLGTGIKLPLGEYAHPETDWLILYPGTGSWDGLTQSSLYFQRGKWGLIQESSVVIRSENKYNYRQGNSLNASVYGFRNIGQFTVLLGMQYAANTNDALNGLRVVDSPVKGTSFSASAGVGFRWDQLIAQVYYHVPVYQYLGNGYVTQRTGFNVGIYCLFK